jgi:hypothetical protein
MMPVTAMPAPPDTASTRKEVAAPSPQPSNTARHATDDEILGLISDAKLNATDAVERDAESERQFESGERGSPSLSDKNERSDAGEASRPHGNEDPDKLRAAFEANPELRQAWDDAKAYREVFATPQEARKATALLADLNRIDTLFYSSRQEDHAELARSIAELDPAAFSSLARAIAEQARQQERPAPQQAAPPSATPFATRREPQKTSTAGLSAAQAEFFQAANAAAVQGVLDAIETQVERMLPEGAPKSALNRVVGEIYRELDATLGSNRQLSQQVRDAFRSGALDANHQRSVVSLITGRARQALPGVAKRVMNEWTSTVVAANQERRARQRAAEHRVDIAGSSGGSEGRRSMAPRDIDYARMSDGDILNL